MYATRNKTHPKISNDSFLVRRDYFSTMTAAWIVALGVMAVLRCVSIFSGASVHAFSIVPDPKHFAAPMATEKAVSHYFSARATTTTTTVLYMAKPGQSESQKRQERENEIRSKLAQLKGSGKMKKGGSESIMAEAENFMNPKESPLRKFERAHKARQEAAAAEAALLAKNEPEESTTSE
jgi:hypothetical protein